MQILFIDESGTPPPPDKVREALYFVLGGVVIPDEFWHRVKEDLELVKKKYAIKGEIKWRYFAPGHRIENTLSHLDGERKERLRSDLYLILNKYKSIKTICVITDIALAYQMDYINNADDLYWFSYKQIIERFQYYLQDISRISGQKINGIIVCDNRAPKDDKRLRELHAKLLEGEVKLYSGYKHLIEGIFISPSHLSVGIQFADMTAGAVLRKMKGDARFFAQIKDTFRKSERGEIEGYGLVKFPKK